MDNSTIPTIWIVGNDGEDGADGLAGEKGINSKAAGTGQPGKDGSYSWWICGCAKDGTAGADAPPTGGGKGGDGSIGGNAPDFTLTVNTFIFNDPDATLYITSQGGKGGNGGNGGMGGNGDTGGKGGTNKQTCLDNGKCQPTNGGKGGDGSNGGKGGNGAAGGNGGNITIYYKNDQNLRNVVPLSSPGGGGVPGKGGNGGTGGAGGANETPPGGNAFPGSGGIKPGDGNPGDNGGRGKVNIIQLK